MSFVCDYYAIGAAAFFGASVAWTSSFLVAAHHQQKMALSANINMLNDNITAEKH